jgi:hypothetical protein
MFDAEAWAAFLRSYKSPSVLGQTGQETALSYPVRASLRYGYCCSMLVPRRVDGTWARGLRSENAPDH